MNARNLVLKTLLVLVLAAALLPGCNKDKGKGGGTTAAGGDPVWIKVNGKPILKSQVEDEMVRFRQQLSSQMPEEQLANMEPMIKHDAMQRAVQAAVLEQHADAENITIDDAAIDAELKKLKTQFPNDEAFQARLKDLKLTEADLKAELKKSLRFQKLLEAKVTVPEPTEDEIKAVYERANERLLEPAKATAYSIFISVPTTATEDEKKKRKEQAEDILKKLQGGGDFQTLAKEFSEASSKAEGGKETFTKGTQVKELDDVIFAMKPGELSKVIETPQGFYIIKLEEITPEKTPTIDDVRAEIIQFLKEGQQRDKMQAYVEGLVKEAKVEYIEALPDMSRRYAPAGRRRRNAPGRRRRRAPGRRRRHAPDRRTAPGPSRGRRRSSPRRRARSRRRSRRPAPGPSPGGQRHNAPGGPRGRSLSGSCTGGPGPERSRSGRSVPSLIPSPITKRARPTGPARFFMAAAESTFSRHRVSHGPVGRLAEHPGQDAAGEGQDVVLGFAALDQTGAGVVAGFEDLGRGVIHRRHHHLVLDHDHHHRVERTDVGLDVGRVQATLEREAVQVAAVAAGDEKEALAVRFLGHGPLEAVAVLPQPAVLCGHGGEAGIGREDLGPELLDGLQVLTRQLQVVVLAAEGAGLAGAAAGAVEVGVEALDIEDEVVVDDGARLVQEVVPVPGFGVEGKFLDDVFVLFLQTTGHVFTPIRGRRRQPCAE